MKPYRAFAGVLVAVMTVACSDDVAPPPETPVVENLEAAAGPTAGGTTITVIGENFGRDASVLFGDSPAEVTSSRDEEVLATLPEGEGTVDVRVEASGARSDPWDFTYDAPSIEGIEPAAATTEGGGVITLTGENFGRTPEVSVGDQVVDLESWDHWQAVFETPPGGPGPAPVRLTVGGQSSNTADFAYVCPEGQVEREGACVETGSDG